MSDEAAKKFLVGVTEAVDAAIAAAMREFRISHAGISHASGTANSPHSVLFEWIEGYCYGSGSDEAVTEGVESLLAHLDDSGCKIVRKG